jgi:hypothetical protein
MVWHSDNKSTNGLVWHVANNKAWAHIDAMWLDFVSEVCNVILGFVTEGVNPVGLLGQFCFTITIFHHGL